MLRSQAVLLLLFLLLLFMIWRILLRPSAATVGAAADASPTSVAPWAESVQRIGFIRLRLEPPDAIRSSKDLFYIFLNHDFLRLLISVLWLLVCGYVESFLAQLSDIRYSHTTYERVL